MYEIHDRPSVQRSVTRPAGLKPVFVTPRSEATLSMATCVYARAYPSRRASSRIAHSTAVSSLRPRAAAEGDQPRTIAGGEEPRDVADLAIVEPQIRPAGPAESVEMEFRR